MSRPVVLSNGELHVGLNNSGLVHDFYFPYVGQENHSAGPDIKHLVGVWAEGAISWLDSGDWEFKFDYPHQALIGHTVATNAAMGIQLEFDDMVDATVSAFVRNIHVVNLREQARDVRLFMHQAFAIGNFRSNADTAQYLPDSNAILHYRGRRAFIVSGMAGDQPFDQYSVGLFGIEGHEGTFRDADDGELSQCNVEHGRVDSVLRFRLDLQAHSSARVYYWIAAGTSMREALYVHNYIREAGPKKAFDSTANWWHKWLEPAHAFAAKLDPDFRDSFIKSVMIVKSQIDKRGAVMASTDTTMLNYSRDAYAYCWPRDGALVLWPLIRMGYIDEPRRFFDFCRRSLHASGYLMHKYQADGSIGSSWHPYLHEDGSYAPPIQEDETAIVLFVFAQFYATHQDSRVLHDFYPSMIQPMADFMAGYIDETTGLPRPSYDLWEEVYETTTYTTAVVTGALMAAAELAEVAGDPDNAVKWRSAANDMRAAAHKYLFSKDRGCFYKGLRVSNGSVNYDATIDTSSVFGAFMYGLFPVESDEMRVAVGTLERQFATDGSDARRLPRYEGDDYCRMDPSAPSNIWFITTMWLAQFYLETGRVDEAKSILAWVRDQTGSTGVLSEQIDPRTGEFLSVAPLTWSHAEYIATLLDTLPSN